MLNNLENQVWGGRRSKTRDLYTRQCRKHTINATLQDSLQVGKPPVRTLEHIYVINSGHILESFGNKPPINLTLALATRIWRHAFGETSHFAPPKQPEKLMQRLGELLSAKLKGGRKQPASYGKGLTGDGADASGVPQHDRPRN